MEQYTPTTETGAGIKSEPLTVSLQQAADTIGVSYLTAWRLVQRGLLGAIPGLRHKRIPTAELHRFISSGVKP